jgi:hypothetical protein
LKCPKQEADEIPAIAPFDLCKIFALLIWPSMLALAIDFREVRFLMLARALPCPRPDEARRIEVLLGNSDT